MSAAEGIESLPYDSELNALPLSSLQVRVTGYCSCFWIELKSIKFQDMFLGNFGEFVVVVGKRY